MPQFEKRADAINILIVDDQPSKLMSTETILAELGENLLKANSATEALQVLLKQDVAVLLVDVCMPDLDGFQLAQMVREHPRFRETAIIFISAIQISEIDSLKGYEMGAVDYVPVPVVPGVLRAKVRVFVDLYRKTRALARINDELEQRVADRTVELEAAIARQELLSREVDHRARNALAVIQAIVSLTPATSAAEFAKSVDGRIRAMARAHTLLSESRWNGADLARLVHEELAPYLLEERVDIQGAAVMIKPTVAQNLALAIHELTTNAAKYGALSSPRGKLSVSWTLSADTLTLHWIERNGPAAQKPEKLGFGAKVIDSSVRAQLSGEIEYDWRLTGLHCTLRLPREHFSPPASAPGPKIAIVKDEPESVNTSPISGRRILVVEDEPLIGMMLVRLMTELGAEPIGPFGALADAYAALPQTFDAAVLDVNVGGELIYPFAEEVDKLGAPIVFLTGYESESIAERFAHAPVLTKPIEQAALTEALANALAVAQQRSALAG